MKHKAIRVDNLMYRGCEPHWKCTLCGFAVPFHCYTKEQFENQCCGCHKINCNDCDRPTEKGGAEKKETCGSCEWAMPIKGTINGVYVSYIECQNPEKVWNHNSSRRKKRTTPKCRFWQPKKKGGE